jgi:hypothetical protein
METIIKKITLNDFKNFDPNVTIKCLDDETDGCWGKIPMDLIVEDRALIGELPLVETMVNDNGTVYVYAIGVRPEQTYNNIQITIMEVSL